MSTLEVDMAGASAVRDFTHLTGPYYRIPKIFSLPYYPEMMGEVTSIIRGMQGTCPISLTKPAGKLNRILLNVSERNRVSVADLHDIVSCLIAVKYSSACEPYTQEGEAAVMKVREATCRELELTVAGYREMAGEYARNGYGAYSRKRLVDLLLSRKVISGSEEEGDLGLLVNVAEEMFNRILILVSIDALEGKEVNEGNILLPEMVSG